LRNPHSPGGVRWSALRAEVIEQNLALSRQLAHRYAGRGEDPDDLRQVAAHALVKAVDNFDPERGVPFAAYARPYILGALKRHFRDSAWDMHVSRGLQELSHRVTIAVGDLGHQRARTPISSEIADHLGVTIAEVGQAAGAAQAYNIGSLNTPHHRGDGTDLIDVVGGIDPHFVQVDDRATLQPMLAGLKPRERRILTLRFGDGMTQAEIAADIGISQMHVSRLLQHSLRTLRSAMREPSSPASASDVQIGASATNLRHMTSTPAGRAGVSFPVATGGTAAAHRKRRPRAIRCCAPSSPWATGLAAGSVAPSPEPYRPVDEGDCQNDHADDQQIEKTVSGHADDSKNDRQDD
jgi:RNA polymerase sigma-B factor